MNITYTRTSFNPYEEVLNNLHKQVDTGDWHLVGDIELPNSQGTIATVIKPQWLSTLTQHNVKNWSIIPVSIVIQRKDNQTSLNLLRPSIIGAISQDQTIAHLTSEIERETKDLINNIGSIEAPRPTKVIIYSTTSCPYCKLEGSWLDEQKIKHEVKYVDLNPIEAQQMVEKTGQMGVPVTEVQYADMEPEYVVGFDRPRLRTALGIESQVH